MAYKNAVFYSTTPNPDHQALKAQLGSLYGVNAMEIDYNGNGVLVTYDSVTLPDERLQDTLEKIGYRKS